MVFPTSTPPPLNVKTDTMPHVQEPQVEAGGNTVESAERTARIRIKNRRKMYLDRHPSYFTAPDLELSGAYMLLNCRKGTLTSTRSIAI
jgi:hypothetical protein